MTSPSAAPDVLILGAGASGLVCALAAARRGRSVLLVDHLARPGRKLRIAGGGRCNFTNLDMHAGRFLCGNPHFPKSALARFTPADAIALVEGFGLPWEERDNSKLFLRCGADRLADGLLDACAAAGAGFAFGAPVLGVDGGKVFRIRTAAGEFSAPRLVLALGGPSWKGSGGTDLAWKLARRFGLPVVPPRPALAPLLWAGEDGFSPAALTGLALPVSLMLPGPKGPMRITDELLLTHQGLSGPAALRASLHWDGVSPLLCDFLPGEQVGDVLAAASGKALVRNILSGRFPARLAAALAGEAGERRAADLGKAGLASLVARVHAFPVTPSGTPGLAKAEVTAGGIGLAGVSSKDFAIPAVPGLFAVGECLDVTGDLGGCNVHWAFASGRAAGMAV